MKKGVSNVVSIIVLFGGLILLAFGLYKFTIVQITISNSKLYTFTAPYTAYERGILTDKWTGIGCIVSAVLLLLLLLFSVIYSNKHTQSIHGMNYQNNIVKCGNCGLTVGGSTSVCPRCGAPIINYAMPNAVNYAATMSSDNMQAPQQPTTWQDNNRTNYCTMCGNPLVEGQAYCPKCGNKVIQ